MREDKEHGLNRMNKVEVVDVEKDRILMGADNILRNTSGRNVLINKHILTQNLINLCFIMHI